MQQTLWFLLLTYKPQCKRQAHWPQKVHLCNTLPHPGSTTPNGSSQLPQGWVKPPTVLLLTHSKQGLPPSCIIRHHPRSLTAALHHLYFCFNPASLEYCSLCPSSVLSLFSCGGQCPAHQTGWLLIFWCNAELPACTVPPHHVRIVCLLMAMPIPKQKQPPCPYPTHPYLWPYGVPGPLLFSWIGLVKPKLLTHMEYFSTTLPSSYYAQWEEKPVPRGRRELREKFYTLL